MFKNVILLLTLMFGSVYANSCWSKEELADMAQDEFNERARFSLKDAVSCKPVSDVKFYLGRSVFKSDKNGMITLPLPPENMDMELPIKIEKEGYITTKERLLVSFGSFWKTQFLITKMIPKKSARFVLSWGERPSDLDLHLKAKNYHISYRNIKKNKEIQDIAKLDRDSRNGYGPETITIKKIEKSDEYALLVHLYSNIGNINNRGEVKVYLNSQLDKTVKLPNTREKCIEIATMKNNQIIYDTKILKEGSCR